jgi:hypothetical protein
MADEASKLLGSLAQRGIFQRLFQHWEKLPLSGTNRLCRAA